MKLRLIFTMLVLVVTVGVGLLSFVSGRRDRRQESPVLEQAQIAEMGEALKLQEHIIRRPMRKALAARNWKPAPEVRIRSETEQKIWDNMTDRDRAEQDALDTAFEKGQETGNFEEWRRLLEIQAERPPWEYETRKQQEWRLARGITNFTVIEDTNAAPQKPLFVPSKERLKPLER